MGWLLDLYETYEANLNQVGNTTGQEMTLLPISHTTQTAHIEVRVTPNGEFHSANVITDKNDAITVIPATEKSSSRSGKVVAPYPLHDKLMYVAGDFTEFGGEIKTSENPFSVYINQLKDWVESPYATDQVKSIYKYLQKGQLLKDLINEKIIWLDENGKLLSKWGKKEGKPPIFSVVAGGQESAFVRFTVRDSSKTVDKKVWEDSGMYQSFIQYYNEKLEEKELCYVTGKHLPYTERHANKIRNSADKAKLISANDKNGFTYRGRFSDSKQVATISYDVSQKAHNALKWLINKQGKIIDGRVFLVWGNDLKEVPDITDDGSIFAYDEIVNEQKAIVSTSQYDAEQISRAIDGYKAKLAVGDKVHILVLDSATTGRMAVLYYRSLDKSYYLDKIKEWHTSCIWLHKYRKDTNEKIKPFIGAPAPRDIAFAAYGPKASDKVIKELVERMIPCIVDGQKIPVDILRSSFYRASNPVGMKDWEWEKTLSIACALINKSEGGYSVALDKETNDRDYLFGRLLAIADVLERHALGDDKRATNARRYMNSFAQHPARTWTTIQSALQPYQARLGEKVWYYNKLLDEVGSKIRLEDFNNKPLSGKYLLGFYSQRHELYQKKDKKSISNDIN
ncbi:type I-C CRISPR-associated protein Cas8c/Csd1 [Pallidibacillus pasinlerensis]|uniref:Type I-C CRISPR-associated protein Cas8c/Csd1 n=1 Tax=Pallidibacillus pasinlerensis TaxID=2703818 RepID=A0ABX0A6H7_9BACI|nr:type I-C CRISPR-associated protein Cas8c/Csd1 [Pallidibacillus pasinlerensis]NCU19001.1 type I-C CRISPR-associated protein Cas8c/Csd1 [Pallidibacillus pasinlerensis]